jgi:hypothetical protein
MTSLLARCASRHRTGSSTASPRVCLIVVVFNLCLLASTARMKTLLTGICFIISGNVIGAGALMVGRQTGRQMAGPLVHPLPPPSLPTWLIVDAGVSG